MSSLHFFLENKVQEMSLIRQKEERRIDQQIEESSEDIKKLEEVLRFK